MAAVSYMDFSAALEASEDPSQWACEICGSSSDCWMALEDGIVVCADGEHAKTYATDHLKVPYLIQIAAPQAVKNFKTGATIRLGSRKTDDGNTVAAIATIRSRLRGMQTLGGTKWAAAKGWAKIRLAVKLFGVPFLTRASQLARRKRDAQATALSRWASLDVWRAFRKWRDVARTPAPTEAGKVPAAGSKRLRQEASVDLSLFEKPAAPKTKLEEQARLGRTGLRNLGNTCYMNSTIQALTHIPLFRAYLFALQAPTRRKVIDMLSSLELGHDISSLSVGGSGDMPPMPRGPPKLMRLNSGLADLLEFGPTLGNLTKEPPGTEEAVLEKTDGGRRTRAKVERSASGTAARLQSRVLTKSLHEVASRLFGFEPMVIFSPDSFLKTMWVNLPQFSGFNQQDAEEFVRALLTRLEEEDMAAESKDTSSPPAFNKMFAGATSVTVTCTKCKTESRREQPFFGPYTIDVPQPYLSTQSRGFGTCSISDCLSAAFTSEKLEGDCAYECATCKKKVTAIMSTKFSKIPPILILHVNRISWLHGGAKVFTSVVVPGGELSLQPWSEASTADVLRHYDLLSIVRHVGSGIRQGHYMGYARNDTSDTWHCYNDARVNPVQESEFDEIQGYLYFFQRRHL